ncbi:hypothetical protein [Mycobacterium riyadhense]|uniref:Uncharacterized protein n=2 Tax=Mycobacterium riyadhense TaxID=486698 RepID=A0A653EZN2_9MYCO|nr:hypothetical protein [Mycobacterium riyadhense]MCV7144764.1 hypothetical protein [Mycobacterium riyadhense]VTP02985.1 hypothetical protein BIN_B_04803 [Mycobacterium riyadhense]
MKAILLACCSARFSARQRSVDDVSVDLGGAKMGERNYILTEAAADAENARLTLLEQLFDPATIRRLERLDIAAGVGLELAGGEIDCGIARSGEPAFEFERRTAEAAAPALIAAGLMTEAEDRRARAVRSAPATVINTWSLVAAWGRRPN